LVVVSAGHRSQEAKRHLEVGGRRGKTHRAQKGRKLFWKLYTRYGESSEATKGEVSGKTT